MSLRVHMPISGRLTHRNGLALLALVPGLVVLTSGCVFIPTPHYYAGGSRQNLTAQSTNLMRPGVDTIEDVMLKLGEPDDISPDERRIVYKSKKVAGIILATADLGDPEFPINHHLNLALDDRGVVTNLAYCTYWGWLLGSHQGGILAGSIRGEKITTSFDAIWYPDTDVGEPGMQWWRHPFVIGNLLFTESALYFIARTQWPNDRPALNLRYDCLAECRFGDNDGEHPAFIVRTTDQKVHSFAFWDRDSRARKAAGLACNLTQSKIKPTQTGK